MSLSAQNVVESTKRLLAFFNPTDEQRALYVGALLESVAWMKPYEFDEVCKAMVPEMAQGRRPVPKQFIAVYHKIASERNWITAQSRTCSSCGGLTWVYCTVRREDGTTHRAMKGCPTCRTDHYLKPGLTEVSVMHTQQQTWDSFTDAQKAQALEAGEKIAKGIGHPEYFERFIEKTVSGFGGEDNGPPAAREVSV